MYSEIAAYTVGASGVDFAETGAPVKPIQREMFDDPAAWIVRPAAAI